MIPPMASDGSGNGRVQRVGFGLIYRTKGGAGGFQPMAAGLPRWRHSDDGYPERRRRPIKFGEAIDFAAASTP